MDFEFRGLPVALGLQRAFAAAFAERTRPGAGVRSAATAETCFDLLRTFAVTLSRSPVPPTAAGHLLAVHLDEWVLARGGPAKASRGAGQLKLALKKIEGLDARFRAKLSERNGPRATPAGRSYSVAELQRITAAARRDLRAAAHRIRGNRDLLHRWRLGQITEDADRVAFRRGRLLDHVDRFGDIPRYETGARMPRGWVSVLGSVTEHMTALQPNMVEAAAFTVLLVAMTGENLSTIVRARAVHLRADGHADGPATAIIGLDKRRRGAARYRDAALVDLPSWIPMPETITDPGPVRVPLGSPFAVYSLLVELGASTRQALSTDRLVVWWSAGGGGTRKRPREGIDDSHIRTWAARHDLPADATGRDPMGPAQLEVTLSRLRLSHAELNQKPVAHTEQTLANEYLLRNRGNLDEYRLVVAAALEGEAAKARTRGALRVLTGQDLDRARDDAAAVAREHGLDVTKLQQLLAGELDTVMAGCTDHAAGPHAPSGQPCRASFMLCLSCPCARAAPHHLPFQVLVHDAIAERRQGMTPLRWAERFALPFAQLTDLLEKAGPAPVEQARRAATTEQRQIVERFLRRELDLQ